MTTAHNSTPTVQGTPPTNTTESVSYHILGDMTPQNTASSVKATLPHPLRELGLLPADSPVLWEVNEQLGLPVVTEADNFGEMLGRYGKPEYTNVSSGTVTIPKAFTPYAHDGGHPSINFERTDTLGIFAPESMITDDFTRLYVGTLNDYKRLLCKQETLEVIWGESYERCAFNEGQSRKVREVTIFNGTRRRRVRPAEEGWVRAETLLDEGGDSRASGVGVAGDD